MVSKRTIRKVVNQIVKACKPEKVILFGSHAYGKPEHDSDVDILVVTSLPGTFLERHIILQRAIKEKGFDIDLVIRTPEQVEKSLAGRDWFVQEIFEKGKVYYAR